MQPNLFFAATNKGTCVTHCVAVFAMPMSMIQLKMTHMR